MSEAKISFPNKNYFLRGDFILFRIKIFADKRTGKIQDRGAVFRQSFQEFKFGVNNVLLATEHSRMLLINAGQNADLGLDDAGSLRDFSLMHRADLANKNWCSGSDH